MQNQFERSQHPVVENKSRSVSRLLVPAGLLLGAGTFWFACQAKEEDAAVPNEGASAQATGDEFASLVLPNIEGVEVRSEVEAPLPPPQAVQALMLHPMYELKVRCVDTEGNPLCGIEPEFLLKNPGVTPEGKTQLAQPLPKTKLNGESVKVMKQERLIKGMTETIDPGWALPPEKQEPLAEGFARIEVFAKKQGYGNCRQIIDLDLRKESHEITLVLDRGVRIFGTVKFADGSPVVDGRGVANMNNIFTNSLGEFVTYERDCFGNKGEVIGLHGYKPNEPVGFRIWSKTPGFSEVTKSLKFENSDLYVDVVLEPTPEVTLTLRDCVTLEFLQPENVGIFEVRGPTEPLYGTSVLENRPDGPAGIREKFSFFMKYPNAHMLVVGTADHLPHVFELQEGAVKSGKPLEFEACLSRLKQVSILGTIQDTTPEGEITETSAGRFRVTFALTFLDREPYLTTTDIAAGAPIKSAWVYNLAYCVNGLSKYQLNDAQIAKIECITPDLRPAELRDANGEILAPASDFQFGASPLLKPISLLVKPGDPDPDIAKVHLFIKRENK